MRRMIVPSEYQKRPTQKDLVYCGQFVADNIVIKDIKAGKYLCKLTFIPGGGTNYSEFILNFGDNIKSKSPVFTDENDDMFYLYTINAPNIPAMKVFLRSINGTITHSNYHIDIYRIGDIL